ncbi:hypothetical protein RB595_005034 [Gaeumannomyces hyphopodioides]
MRFSTAVCLALATVTAQVAATPVPRKCTNANPCVSRIEVKKVNAGMIWFPGSPGSGQVIKDAVGKIIG